MHWHPTLLPTLFVSLALLSACGEPRRFGDPGGVPVTITAQVDRAFFNTMENRQGRPSAGAGVGFGSGGTTGVGVGIGFSFSSTQVYLLGGDQVGQGNVFHKEVKWGDNTFSVPLTPGRTIHFTVQAEGGRRGWEALGPVVIPASDPHVAIQLDSNGGKLTVTPPAAATPPPATTTPVPTPTTPAPATTTPAATPAPSATPAPAATTAPGTP